MGDGINVPMTFEFVTDRVVIGSRPRTNADLVTLRNATITHVIDVCEEDDTLLLEPKQTWESLGFWDYCWNPTADDGQPKPASWFYKTIRFAMPIFQNSGPIVFVHCDDGVNRGPSSAYAILRALGLKTFQARHMIELARPIDLMGLRYAAEADNAIINGW